MGKCPHTGFDCTSPHIKCEACDVYLKALDGIKDVLEPPVGFLTLPDPCPYVKFGSPSGRKGFGIEVGIKGTF